MTRSQLTALAGALVLGACKGDSTDTGYQPACDEAEYRFVDADGDGWGDPHQPGEITCEPAAGTARNDLDCDDGDPAVTGRIAYSCPQELLVGSQVSTPVAFIAVQAGAEVVVTHGDSPPINPAAAGLACGRYGWGGHLATPRTVVDLQTVLDAISQDTFAAWVGFNPDMNEWGAFEDGVWTPDADGGMYVTNSSFCTGDLAHYQDRRLPYLAVVVRAGSDDWCLGTPDEALPAAPTAEDPPYAIHYGHMACERPFLDPQAYAFGQGGGAGGAR